MIIRHSNQLLEQLSELEEKIEQLERMMSELKIDGDNEKLMRLLLTRRYQVPSGQKN